MNGNAVLLAAASALVVVVAACDPAESRVDGFVVTDSAGVRVVEHAGLEEIEPTRARLTLESRLGGSLAPEGREMAFLMGTVVFADDRLHVTDAAFSGVRSFDSRGGVAGAYGRRGEGPGEFIYPAMVGLLGADSLVVYDGRLRRISILGTSGRVERVFRVPDEVGQFARAVGLVSEGRLVFAGSFGLRLLGRERVIRDTIPVTVVDMEGDFLGTFGDVRTAGYFEGPPEVSPSALEMPFMPGDRVAAGRSGAYIAQEDRAEVRRYDGEGTLETIIRLDVAPIRVRDADVDSLREAEAEVSGLPEGVRTLFARMPIPRDKPPFEQVIVDPDGRLWLSLTDEMAGETSRWLVFRPDGTLVEAVELPAGRLVGLDGFRFAILTHDEYDAPVIEVYRRED